MRGTLHRKYSAYDFVTNSVHLGCLGLVDAMMLRSIDAKHLGLLERPRGHVPRQLRIPRGQAIGERFSGIRITEEVNAPRKDDARVLGGLKACDEAEVAAGPETLTDLFGGFEDGGSPNVVGRVGCKAGRGSAQDGDEVGGVAEGVWSAREPDGGDA